MSEAVVSASLNYQTFGSNVCTIALKKEINRMEKEELIGQATPEQIEIWKKKYGRVSALIVDGHIGYVKKPDRKTLSYASVAGSKDPMKFNEVLLTNCWLGGSEEIKKDDDMFLSVSGKLSELINVKEVELVNL